MGDADDEIEGPQSFDLEEKLRSPRFEKNLVKEMIGAGNGKYISKSVHASCKITVKQLHGVNQHFFRFQFGLHSTVRLFRAFSVS